MSEAKPIVIDVGCARYGGDYSIERLLEEFDPEVLYGFDPNAATAETYAASHVHIHASAAWTEDGTIGFLSDGLNSCLTYRKGAPQVPCIDLARFIRECSERHPGQRLILKLDAEGSEYDLLLHLIVTGADELLSLAIVEWHPKTDPKGEDRRRVIEKEIHCAIREWPH